MLINYPHSLDGYEGDYRTKTQQILAQFYVWNWMRPPTINPLGSGPRIVENCAFVLFRRCGIIVTTLFGFLRVITSVSLR